MGSRVWSGTLDEHRKKGLMRGLNDALRRIMLDEGYLLGVIQGIPGFYHNFGYYYSVPLNNHIDAPFHIMPDELENSPWTFAPAQKDDIPFLLEEDERYRSYYSITVKRDQSIWDYLLSHSKNTEYGSDYFIMEHSKNGRRFYFRVPRPGIRLRTDYQRNQHRHLAGCIHGLAGFRQKTGPEKEQTLHPL